MPKNQNRRGTSNTGMQMKGSATDWTIGADYEILHKPYSDLLREIHNSYHNIKHILHPKRDTSTRTMKPTPQKVRKAVKKGPAKKRKWLRATSQWQLAASDDYACRVRKLLACVAYLVHGCLSMTPAHDYSSMMLAAWFFCQDSSTMMLLPWFIFMTTWFFLHNSLPSIFQFPSFQRKPVWGLTLESFCCEEARNR